MKILTYEDLFKEASYFHKKAILDYDFKKNYFLDSSLVTKNFYIRMNLSYSRNSEYNYVFRNLSNSSLFEDIMFDFSNNKVKNFFYIKYGRKFIINNEKEQLNKEYKEIYNLFFELNEKNTFKIKEKVDNF